MKLIEKEKAIEAILNVDNYGDGVAFEVLGHAQMEVGLLPTVDAIPCDDNFGFAGYIAENNEQGIRVQESWNKDLNDEEMMCVMCGIIQDVNADKRLKKLWDLATKLAEFVGDEDETD